MLENPLTRFEHEIETGEIRVLGFELIHDPERLQVVLKATEITHAGIERILPGVSKRRMTQIMRQANCLCQWLVELQGDRDGPPDLRDLERVRQSSSVQIAFVVNENLGLVDKTSKGCRMDYAVAVALILSTIG